MYGCYSRQFEEKPVPAIQYSRELENFGAQLLRPVDDERFQETWQPVLNRQQRDFAPGRRNGMSGKLKPSVSPPADSLGCT